MTNIISLSLSFFLSHAGYRRERRRRGEREALPYLGYCVSHKQERIRFQQQPGPSPPYTDHNFSPFWNNLGPLPTIHASPFFFLHRHVEVQLRLSHRLRLLVSPAAAAAAASDAAVVAWQLLFPGHPDGEAELPTWLPSSPPQSTRCRPSLVLSPF
ncbi:unnamed protein product [Acanthosepion pharaonis]|uniref:Uncharacterized protein n=1 Tax=Acanthosepion pharaonis TaxID=158019 RepID=A0A812D0R2_ACAPH|nr:unnamed protein product [Sepia pharaonis]